MIAVAAQVMPKNSFPLYAAKPMSLPYLLMASTALTMMAVEMALAMPMVRKARMSRTKLTKAESLPLANTPQTAPMKANPAKMMPIT